MNYKKEIPDVCPDCKESFCNGSEKHLYDAIEDYGKCTDFLGYCPYCEPSEKEINHYVTADGSICISCGSDNIEGGSIDIEGTQATQEIRCLVCDASWYDVYALTTITCFQGEHNKQNCCNQNDRV